MKWTSMMVEIFGTLLIAFALWLLFGHPGLS